MPRMVLEVDYKRCTGCHACELICALAHSGVVRPTASAIRIASSSDHGVNIPLVCVSCRERPCLEACPVGAIRLDERLKVPVIDAETCTGCQACIAACPYEGIFFDPASGKAIKCDLCGGDPLCAQACVGAFDMPGALHAVNLEEKDEESYVQRVQERLSAFLQLKDKGESHGR